MVFFLCAVLLAFKFFGKTGLYAFSVFAILLSNIQVCLSIDVFGVAATGGNAIYAATFLTTDILSERYGKKTADRAVTLGFFAMLLWLCGTQITLLFVPNEADFAYPAMKELFSILPRLTLGSLLAYLASQYADVRLYHAIWKRSGNSEKFLWLRNNGSTLVSQLIDTVIFVTVAFLGVYETDVFISIMVTTYLFKAICALCDTPFMYIARKIKIKDEKDAAKR